MWRLTAWHLVEERRAQRISVAGSRILPNRLSAIIHYVFLPYQATALRLLINIHDSSAGSRSSVSVSPVAVAGAVAVVLAAVIAGTIAIWTSRYTIRKTLEHQRVQLFNERYSTAADKLGHERPATRLAGLYALAGLADDWKAQRQTCVDVLCSYMRIPYEPDPASPNYRRGEREVRRTMIRVIRDHLRPGFSAVSWTNCNFSFEGATFDCGDLTGARFIGGNVSFHGVHFVSGTFHFNRVEFDGARVSFADAQFAGADVRFDRAKFQSGEVTFKDAKRTGGSVSFKDVTLAAQCTVQWGIFNPPS